jgi:hypothetical protein
VIAGATLLAIALGAVDDDGPIQQPGNSVSAGVKQGGLRGVRGAQVRIQPVIPSD